jgi:Domain of unknown function (DUF4123)
MAVDEQAKVLLRQNLLHQLFSESRTAAYAVLDGAANPALLKFLYAKDAPEFACLYPGQLAPDLAACAPYLVRLSEDSVFTDWLVSNCWNAHWGIYALADCSLRVLRDHLRTLTRVYHPETHKPLLFRYYDPRVLNRFLPGCSEKQKAQFFGPVQVWFAEDEQDSALRRHVCAKSRVVAG